MDREFSGDDPTRHTSVTMILPEGKESEKAA
jgi:hypothetical protein